MQVRLSKDMASLMIVALAPTSTHASMILFEDAWHGATPSIADSVKTHLRPPMQIVSSAKNHTIPTTTKTTKAMMEYPPTILSAIPHTMARSVKKITQSVHRNSHPLHSNSILPTKQRMIVRRLVSHLQKYKIRVLRPGMRISWRIYSAIPCTKKIANPMIRLRKW